MPWVAKLIPNDTNTRFVVRGPFNEWIADSFNKNMPWDTFVYDMLATSGTVTDEPEVTFYIANPNVDKLTDKVGEYFMGLQLECAQCHNHPFTTWKQEEYWGMATFFSKVSPERAWNSKEGCGQLANCRHGRDSAQHPYGTSSLRLAW